MNKYEVTIKIDIMGQYEKYTTVIVSAHHEIDAAYKAVQGECHNLDEAPATPEEFELNREWLDDIFSYSIYRIKQLPVTYQVYEDHEGWESTLSVDTLDPESVTIVGKTHCVGSTVTSGLMLNRTQVERLMLQLKGWLS